MIKGFKGTTLIDFPGKIASIVFVGGCNFRCPYCHNPELVLPSLLEELPLLTMEYVLGEIERRNGFIQGVTISGGEPLTWRDLPELIKGIKSLGLSVKLDTNGYFPERIEELVELVDYVAMDIKTSPEKYCVAAGVDVEIDRLRKSIDTVKGFKDYEFRTTVVPGYVDQKDIQGIGGLVKGAKRFVFQQFRPSKAINQEALNITPYPLVALEGFKRIMEDYVEEVNVRSYPVSD